MGAKHTLLDVARAQIVVIVEPGLADADDLGVLGQCRQTLRQQIGVIGGFVRMGADRTPDVVFTFGDRAHPGNWSRRVPIVSIVPTPAARARAITASRSASKSGKSRWQWLSTSITALPSPPIPPPLMPRDAST